MKLINEIFKKYKLKEETLIKYGFILNDNIYSYNKSIHNNSFELQIKITNKIIEVLDIMLSDKTSEYLNKKGIYI